MAYIEKVNKNLQITAPKTSANIDNDCPSRNSGKTIKKNLEWKTIK